MLERLKSQEEPTWPVDGRQLTESEQTSLLEWYRQKEAEGIAYMKALKESRAAVSATVSSPESTKGERVERKR